MKKILIFLLGLTIFGSIAYFAGYYLYENNHSEVEWKNHPNVQENIKISEVPEEDSGEYYLAKIEQNMFTIYKMPEKEEYDSIDLKSLQFFGDEKQKFTEGIVFYDLIELYEFLENSMS